MIWKFKLVHWLIQLHAYMRGFHEEFIVIYTAATKIKHAVITVTSSRAAN